MNQNSTKVRAELRLSKTFHLHDSLWEMHSFWATKIQTQVSKTFLRFLKAVQFFSRTKRYKKYKQTLAATDGEIAVHQCPSFDKSWHFFSTNRIPSNLFRNIQTNTKKNIEDNHQTDNSSTRHSSFGPQWCFDPGTGNLWQWRVVRLAEGTAKGVTPVLGLRKRPPQRPQRWAKLHDVV